MRTSAWVCVVLLMTSEIAAPQDFMRPATLPAGCTSCQPPCGCCQPPGLKTICVPQPEIVKTMRPIYDVNLRPYCIPKCPLGLSGLLGGHCGCDTNCCC